MAYPMPTLLAIEPPSSRHCTDFHLIIRPKPILMSTATPQRKLRRDLDVRAVARGIRFFGDRSARIHEGFDHGRAPRFAWSSQPWSPASQPAATREPKAHERSLSRLTIDASGPRATQRALRAEKLEKTSDAVQDRRVHASWAHRPRANTVRARAGELVIMRPGLLHRSMTNTSSRRRRILHIEPSSHRVPGPGLRWRKLQGPQS